MQIQTPEQFNQVTADVSGYAVFSAGEVGRMHALAHQRFDEGEIVLGHCQLGEWLDGNEGEGSDWVHLQFHMAVFELALGKWYEAHRRFMQEVLPIAANTADALTDAPALLWRLAMSAPSRVFLPWEALSRTALARMEAADAPFTQLHHLLALAGAGDAKSIQRWLMRAPVPGSHAEQSGVYRFALAMYALVTGDYGDAAIRMRAMQTELALIGGSCAQNLLFEQLADWTELRQAPAA
jgi:hypothetical protein